MKRIINEIMRFLLPVIFIGYIGIISLCTHVHVVDGVTIVHSHLFKNVPGQPPHSHTYAGFQLIHAVTSYTSTTDVVPCFDFAAVCLELPVVLCVSGASVFISAVPGVLSLRGPPAGL